MRFSTSALITIAFTASSVFAAPQPAPEGRGRGRFRKCGAIVAPPAPEVTPIATPENKVEAEKVVVIRTTVIKAARPNRPQKAPVPPTPTTVIVTPTPIVPDEKDTEEPSESSQSPAPSATPSSPPSSGSDGGMLSEINAFRSRAGLPTMEWSSNLASNAFETSRRSGGNSLRHVLLPGSFGQVMAFGADDVKECGFKTAGLSSFALTYYSWLCENPSDPALGGRCPEIYAASNIDNQGQTGHYEILSNAKYNKIGCGFYRNPGASNCDKFSGIWTCDVA